VELKHSVAQCFRIPAPGLNRTRVELKLARSFLIVIVLASLNRTRVELKHKALTARARVAASLNRTRVELKLFFVDNANRIVVRVWIEPEWNWNYRDDGQELGKEPRLNRTRVELKPFKNPFYDAVIEVWIEPEWNWNSVQFVTGQRFRLQVWIEPEWNWNIIFHVMRVLIMKVWIEPEWNWNFVFFRAMKPVLRRLNRTRVELKPLAAGQHTYQFFPVWIEPEWNWNELPIRAIEVEGDKFESNQSGIETSA